MFLCNARSIVNKFPEMNQLMYSMTYDIILVTESWLTEGISSGLIDPCNRFTIIRRDRCSGRGGGVCALIDKSIAVAEVALSGDYSELELVVFGVLNVLPTVRMFVAYRPPNYDQNASHYVNLLLNCVDKYSCNSRSSVINSG